MESVFPLGICPKRIDYDVVDGKVTNVHFEGGCPGNLMGISKLIEGMAVEDVVTRFKGITCGNKPTSCPDQLAKALERHNN